MRTYHQWTTHEDALLLTGVGRRPLEQLAADIGVSLSAVKSRLKVLRKARREQRQPYRRGRHIEEHTTGLPAGYVRVLVHRMA